MRLALQIISWLALVMTVLPSLIYFSGNMELTSVIKLLNAASIVWFVATPFWMDRKTES